MSCEKFVWKRLSAIVIIAFLTIVLKWVGQALDSILKSAGSYSTLAWFVAIATSLGLGVYFQRSLDIRNMWKSPFGGD